MNEIARIERNAARDRSIQAIKLLLSECGRLFPKAWDAEQAKAWLPHFENALARYPAEAITNAFADWLAMKARRNPPAPSDIAALIDKATAPPMTTPTAVADCPLCDDAGYVEIWRPLKLYDGQVKRAYVECRHDRNELAQRSEREGWSVPTL